MISSAYLCSVKEKVITTTVKSKHLKTCNNKNMAAKEFTINDLKKIGVKETLKRRRELEMTVRNYSKLYTKLNELCDTAYLLKEKGMREKLSQLRDEAFNTGLAVVKEKESIDNVLEEVISNKLEK